MESIRVASLGQTACYWLAVLGMVYYLLISSLSLLAFVIFFILICLLAGGSKYVIQDRNIPISYLRLMKYAGIYILIMNILDFQNIHYIYLYWMIGFLHFKQEWISLQLKSFYL